MLQILRAPLTAPRLECRARCVVVPRRAAETDVRLLLVALQRGNVHRALTRFILLLRRQTTQARVDPGICFLYLREII